MPLDRSSVLREDPAWIRRQLDSDHTRILPVWRDRNLFRQCAERSRLVACYIEKPAVDKPAVNKNCAEVIVRNATQLVYLGHDRAITVAADELEDARWFSAAEIREFGEYDDPDSDLALPRRDSIARTMIETWLSENAG